MNNADILNILNEAKHIQYTFGIKGIFKHNKTGNLYEVLGTNLEDKTTGREKTLYVLYKKIDDVYLYSRTESEFYEEFTPVVNK